MPCCSTFPRSAPPGRGAPDDAAQPVTPDTWQRFLGRVAVLGFQGTAVPLPAYARAIVAGLTGPQPQPQPIAEFRASLERVAARPAEVTRARRAGPFAVLAIAAAFVVLLRLAMPSMIASLPPWYRDIALNGSDYVAALQHADSAGSGAVADSARGATAAAVRVVLAAAARDARATPQGATLLGALDAGMRAAIDSAVRRYPAPDTQTVAAARARLHAAHLGEAEEPRGGLSVLPKAVLQSLGALSYLGVAGVVLALLLRGGLLFGLFGIGVVRPDGAPAGRLRCAARSLVAWSPLLVLLALAALPGGVHVTTGTRPAMSVSATTASSPADASHAPGPPPWLRWALGAVAVAGAGVAVWRPTRGVAERVCGVVLVPK